MDKFYSQIFYIGRSEERGFTEHQAYLIPSSSLVSYIYFFGIMKRDDVIY